MKPLVSILIPAYNAEKWMAETLQSASGADLGAQGNHRGR